VVKTEEKKIYLSDHMPVGFHEFYEKYGHDKCEYEGKCIHCCCVCCAVTDESGKIVFPITFKFKPKKKCKIGDQNG